jgi:hypothetical protein
MGTFGTPDSLFGSPGTFGATPPLSTFPEFFVKLWNGDFSYTAQPGVDVRGYNWSTATDLGLIGTTDSVGKIASAAIPARDGDLLRFRVENDTIGRAGFNQIIAGSSQSMDIVLKASNGNLVLRPQARRASGTVPQVIPSQVEIWTLIEGQPINTAQSMGRFPIGPQMQYRANPPADKSYWIIPMPLNTFGVPAYSSLEDVPAENRTLISQNRNSETPVIGLRSASTNTVIPLSVSGFNQFIVAREITIANDSAFTSGVQVTIVDLSQSADKTYQALTRAADPAARTIYCKIRHSTAGVSGPWGNYSTDHAGNPYLQVAWTDTGGSGGSTGGGGGEPPDKRPEMLIT